MDWTPRRRRFRAVLEGAECVHPGSVFDPLSARIAEDLGFEIGMFSGSVASLTILGAPDLTVITLTEFAAQAHRIARASGIPLLVDADHGYGNALSVIRTVEELESAGVAALTIEDTLLPRPFGEPRTRLVSTGEAVGKMRAAVRARQDPALVLVGRTQAVGLEGIGAALERMRAYQRAGIDALFFGGVTTREEVDAIAAVAEVPVMLGNVNAALADRAYLASRNVRVALQGHQPFMAAVQAVHATLRALRDGTPPDRLTGIASNELIERVTRAARYAADTKEFL
ncbi:MAG TPA: isocitrate lyase/PEP mutase family protein [Candidatus Elarobacter sp.]|jgi:carboxyvinyl-carboxyphosphonate phosphorylmutase|nr:isocitrate lyase/PEP mutase family protein [Candidatus Elarobacter sp.]